MLLCVRVRARAHVRACVCAYVRACSMSVHRQATEQALLQQIEISKKALQLEVLNDRVVPEELEERPVGHTVARLDKPALLSLVAITHRRLGKTSEPLSQHNTLHSVSRSASVL